jgi:hypothetical protein
MPKLFGIWPSSIEKSSASQHFTKEARQRALERTRELVYQHRVGHFQVKCRILDGDRVVGVGSVELEYYSRAASLTLGSAKSALHLTLNLCTFLVGAAS